MYLCFTPVHCRSPPRPHLLKVSCGKPVAVSHRESPTFPGMSQPRCAAHQTRRGPPPPPQGQAGPGRGAHLGCGQVRAAGQWPVSGGAEGRGWGQAGRQAATPPGPQPAASDSGKARSPRVAELLLPPGAGAPGVALPPPLELSLAVPRAARLAPRARACAVCARSWSAPV